MKQTLILVAALLCASIAKAQDFPENFMTGGVQYANQSSPHWSGFGADAICMHATNAPCAGLYNFNGVYLTRTNDAKPKLVANFTAGVAQHFRDVAGFRLFILGAGGAAVASTSTKLALNSGLFGVRNVKGHLNVVFLAQAMNSGGTTSVIGALGIGWGR